MKTKYDLDWVIEQMERDWIIQNPDSALVLLRWMKDELDNRKEVIQEQRREILLLKSLNVDIE